MTVTIPDNKIYTLLDELATCLCAQIQTDGLPAVCACSVVPGALVIPDMVGDCADGCGQAWVRLVSAYPSVIIGVPDTQAGNCSSSVGVEVELGVLRCIESEDVGVPELQNGTQLQVADMLAMWRAVSCCRQSKDYMITAYTPVGPEGGLVGGGLTVSILVT
jgi:hypothetical protein